MAIFNEKSEFIFIYYERGLIFGDENPLNLSRK